MGLLPVWSWILGHTVAMLATHSLNIYQSRAIIWDRIVSASRNRKSKWCFVEQFGFAIFWQGLLQQILWAPPGAMAVLALWNFWDVSVPAAGVGLWRVVFLGVFFGTFRTPRENALVSSQLNHKGGGIGWIGSGVLRGVPLTVGSDVWYFFVLWVAAAYFQHAFGTFDGKTDQVTLLNSGWFVVPLLLAVVVATVCSNFCEVVRARVACEMSKEVIDLSDLAEEGRGAGAHTAPQDGSLASMLFSELRHEWGILLANAGVLLRNWRCCRCFFSGESEVFFASPAERYSLKPSALWLGLVPRLLYNCVSFVVTLIWAFFLSSLAS